MNVNEGAVSATLSSLRSECELCGAWARFSGRTEVQDGRTYAILRCPGGDGEFSVWNPDREPLLRAYESARAELRHPEAYRQALATLTGDDVKAISALIAAPPPELPLFSLVDVALPAAAARRWCELLLDGTGWRPTPTRRLRVEEALATALRFESRDGVASIAARLDVGEASGVLERLAARFPPRDPDLLAPLRADPRLLRSMAERLCAVATGAEEEIRAALAMPADPPPLGARGLEVRGGVLSRAGVELRFSPPVLTRAQLDGLFGQGTALPRTGPGASHVLAYEVRLAGAPASVSVFARFSEAPGPESGPQSILLRIDPA